MASRVALEAKTWSKMRQRFSRKALNVALHSYPPTYINVLSQVVVHLGMYAFFSFNFFVSTSAKGKLANYDFSRQSLSDSNAKGEFLALLFGVTSRNAHFIYFSQSKIRTAPE